MDKPTYDELADAFAEYVAATSNEGGLPFYVYSDPPSVGGATLFLDKKDKEAWEEAIAHASEVLYAARDLRSLGQSRSARGKIH